MSDMAKCIMFLGTGSDVGKSIVAAAFCRILKRRGVKVAPFKAQNMSNNSFITVEGGEIGRAQVVQAEASGLLPTNDMNPVLLKPSSGLGAQVVVHGKVLTQMQAVDYHHYKKNLVTAVMESYHRLASKYEVIVLEGAGSCGEINLKKNDLTNFAMARRANAPCILVADIDRGGVFAQIIGSKVLMTRKEKELTQGFIINKFRGDPVLFEDGIRIIERKTNRPVLGLVPFYDHIHIDPEDSVAVQTDKRPVLTPRPDRINVAVIRLPGISNFTDMEALEREPDVQVNYLYRACDLAPYDLLILPGTKNVVEDAVWLKQNGWSPRIKAFDSQGGHILGLCGGYQILGQDILDPLKVESDRGSVKGLGMMPLVTTLAGDKVLRRVLGVDLSNNLPIEGYEIHMGRTVLSERTKLKVKPEPFLQIHRPGRRDSWEDGFRLDDGRVMGAYVHGLMDSGRWRNEFLNRLRQAKKLPLKKKAASSRKGRFHQYDLLADHFEQHTDVERILDMIGQD